MKASLLDVWGGNHGAGLAGWRQHQTKTIVGYYIPYARDANGSRELHWWQQHHPDYVLYKVTNWLSMHESRPNAVAVCSATKRLLRGSSGKREGTCRWIFRRRR